MLKTWGGTEFITKLEKSGVEIGGDGGSNGGDDGSHDDEQSPRGSGQVYQQTHQFVRPGLRLSMMRLMEVEMMLLTSRSKIHQKVEELSKSLKKLKDLKSCKGHWFRKTFTKTPIFHQFDTKNLSSRQNSNSFSVSFCWAQELS